MPENVDVTQIESFPDRRTSGERKIYKDMPFQGYLSNSKDNLVVTGVKLLEKKGVPVSILALTVLGKDSPGNVAFYGSAEGRKVYGKMITMPEFNSLQRALSTYLGTADQIKDDQLGLANIQTWDEDTKRRIEAFFWENSMENAKWNLAKLQRNWFVRLTNKEDIKFYKQMEGIYEKKTTDLLGNLPKLTREEILVLLEKAIDTLLSKPKGQ